VTDSGTFGAVRTVGAIFLVLAVVKGDVLEVQLPRLAVRRGAIATGALAALFIVAQVAQNFFSAQYGLYMGGLVAGVFLFAASPIQRSFERMGNRLPAPTPSGARDGLPDPSRFEAYRAAVRAAVADGVMTPTEEEHLADVAHHLNLSPRDALRLRREVEREMGAR
jgi:hypothetical protein